MCLVKNFVGIKELPLTERPRERALFEGLNVLSNHELIAILFRNGNKHKSAIDLAKELLKETNSLRNLASKSPKELSKISNIGIVRAITLCAAIELGKRLSSEELYQSISVENSFKAYEILKPKLRDLPYEAFGVLFLSQKHTVLNYKELFRGTVTCSAVHPREIIKEALIENAASIIIAHNHPSGSTEPSREDFEITEKIDYAASLFEIRLLDHIIIGGNSFFSFAKEGVLPFGNKK